MVAHNGAWTKLRLTVHDLIVEVVAGSIRRICAATRDGQLDIYEAGSQDHHERLSLLYGVKEEY
jgi:hypothetical protein